MTGTRQCSWISLQAAAIALSVALCGISANAAEQTMTSVAAGGSDSWNSSANWNSGAGPVPSGSDSAVINAGLAAQVSTAPPSYTNGLTLNVGASLRVATVAGATNALGGGPITMADGTTILVGLASTVEFSQDIILTGDAAVAGGWSTTGHHTQRNFDGAISGSHSFTLRGVNNNKFNFNSANTFAMLATTNSAGSNFRINANVAGSMGTGDVVIGTTANLDINAAGTIADTASLHLNGVRSGKTGTTESGPSKLQLDANETVNKFFIDGNQKTAGDYDSTSGLVDSGGNPLITGTGTLTVLTDPPAVPPTIASSDFVDNVYGGPIYEDHPYYPIVYTLTFDLDMDDTTVTTNDFENAGTATIEFGTITEPFDGVFTVPVSTASVGTVILQIRAGADLRSSVNAPLDTTSAIADDTTITNIAGDAPLTTISGTDGGNNSWHTGSNWDNGIPFGMASAAVSQGVTAQINATPRSYEGSLALGTNATLNITGAAGSSAIPLTATTTCHTGSAIILSDGGNMTFGPMLLHDVVPLTHSGNGSHNESRTFSGEISGTGGFRIYTINNNNHYFNTASTYSGGTTITNGGSQIYANIDGALGTGDVHIQNSASLIIASADTIDDNAGLYLSGAQSGRVASKLILNSSETVGIFHIDGLPQQKGTWGPVSSGADFETNSITGSGILTVRWTEIPAAGTVLFLK